MAQPNFINSHPPEFEQFLFASVGEDRKGQVVTVLSTLARFDLDPWHETAKLIVLGHEAAQTRLGTLLARFYDVPTLVSDHDRVAHNLCQLLPDKPPSRALKQSAMAIGDGVMGANGAIWTALAIIFIVLQMFLIGVSGAGE